MQKIGWRLSISITVSLTSQLFCGIEGITTSGPLTRTVADGESTQGNRIPISKVAHNECKSFLRSRFNQNKDTNLILYSDGALEVEQDAILLEDGSLRVLNVTEVDSIVYHSGRYRHRIAYKLLNALSLLCSIVTLLFVNEWVDSILNDQAFFTPLLTPLLLAPVVWVIFDLKRGELATAERLEFSNPDGSSKIIHGIIPYGELHLLSTICILVSLCVGALTVLGWAEDQAPKLGDIAMYSFVCIVVAWFTWNVVKYFSQDDQLAGIRASDVPNGLTHMYFASMAIRNPVRIGSRPRDGGEQSPEMDAFREVLERHDSLLSSIVSANDIFAAPSASLGVIAIRVSTETIMKHTCEDIGITWKPNARPTLDSYLTRYGQQKAIDSRIRSNIENIRLMGNRAAHDFNLDWDEFMITLKQFCEIVGWYSTTIEHPTYESE